MKTMAETHGSGEPSREVDAPVARTAKSSLAETVHDGWHIAGAMDDGDDFNRRPCRNVEDQVRAHGPKPNRRFQQVFSRMAELGCLARRRNA